MVQVTWEEAASDLGRLLEEVKQGEGIRDHSRQRAPGTPVPATRQPGSAVGIVTYIAEDFDAPLEDFREYQ